VQSYYKYTYIPNTFFSNFYMSLIFMVIYCSYKYFCYFYHCFSFRSVLLTWQKRGPWNSAGEKPTASNWKHRSLNS